MAGKPRYYLIACGTSNYNEQDVLNLDSVPTDLQRVVDLLTQKFGYEEALTNLRLNPKKDELIKQFSYWLQHEERCESDRVIFYYSGHGEYCQGDRHYLLMEETNYNQIPQTSLPTEDLVRPLNNEGVKIEQILYIIDTCYSGVGISDVSKFTTQVVQKYQPVKGAGIAVHGIAACRAKDTAKEDVFSRGLEQVINDLSKNYLSKNNGNLYIPLDYLVDEINQIISSEQRASYSASGSEKSAQLFPIMPKTIQTWEEKQDELISELFAGLKKHPEDSLLQVNSFILSSKNIEKLVLDDEFILDCREIKKRLTELGQKPVSRGICPLVACAEWCRRRFSKQDYKLRRLANTIKNWQQEAIRYREDANLSTIQESVKKADLKFQELIKKENLRLQVEIEPEVDNDNGTGQGSGALLLSMNLWLESQDLPLGRFAEKIRLEPRESEESVSEQESESLYTNLEKILPNLIRKARYSLPERVNLTIEYFLPFDYFKTPLEKITFKRGRKLTPLGEEYPIFINSFERYFDPDFLEIRDEIEVKKQGLWNDVNNSVTEPSVPGEFEGDDIYYMGTDPSDSDLERIEEALPIAVWSRNVNQPLIEGEHLNLSEWQNWPNKIRDLRKKKNGLEVTLLWDDLYPKPSQRCRPLNTDHL
ncbi:MAG: caspase family protein [Moorea sp. SIOASIH]|uniref:VMAP-C domain-containing protein n=1 Tax=Moorena sp. SIOASIH TaxID=2607817 RepID=UPI0013BA34F0|nr:caspase family protein [Moorena sp. SIOASIH]NEO40434.1 caspase family protein [Moorena sp. SIOASIH]